MVFIPFFQHFVFVFVRFCPCAVLSLIASLHRIARCVAGRVRRVPAPRGGHQAPDGGGSHGGIHQHLRGGG